MLRSGGREITKTRNSKGPDNVIIVNCLKAEEKASMTEAPGVQETKEGGVGKKEITAQ